MFTGGSNTVLYIVSELYSKGVSALFLPKHQFSETAILTIFTFS